MPSPFPGMNPYLEHEDAWHNFHEQFPGAIIDVLEPQVGDRYFLKVDEHVFIHEHSGNGRRLWGKADAFLGRSATPAPEPVPSHGGTLTAPRQVILPMPERVTESFVEIRDRRTRRLVTIIELLSPSNKRPGDDREQYLNKRAEVLTSQAHFVEIDLLRGWGRMPMAEEVVCDYCVLVSRYPARPRADLWPINLRDPLPTIPIPLLEGDPEPKLDLQAVLHRLYDTKGYAKFMYETEPDPPLAPEDIAWAQSLIPTGVPRHP
jgi:hypothetical protein